MQYFGFTKGYDLTDAPSDLTDAPSDLTDFFWEVDFGGLGMGILKLAVGSRESEFSQQSAVGN